MVSRLFVPVATGLYQIGSRVVAGELALAAALAGIYLPRAAALRYRDPVALRADETRMLLEFTVVGVVLAGILLAAGPVLVWGILGPQYADANVLWPGFVAFVLLRFVASAYGIALTVRAKMKKRIVSQIIAMAATVALILLCHKKPEGPLAAGTSFEAP